MLSRRWSITSEADILCVTIEHENAAGVNEEPSLQVYLIHVNTPVWSLAMKWRESLLAEERKAAQIPLGTHSCCPVDRD